MSLVAQILTDPSTHLLRLEVMASQPPDSLERPITPPPPKPGVNSPINTTQTPISIGTRTNAGAQIHFHKSDYKAYLEEDVRLSMRMPNSEDFLRNALCLALTDDAQQKCEKMCKEIAGDQEYCRIVQEYFDEYNKPPPTGKQYKREANMYPPFNKLFNFVVRKIRESRDKDVGTPSDGDDDSIKMVVCRSDTQSVSGSRARRCPDDVIVEESVKEKHKGSDDANPNPAFSWSEIHGFLEFKLKFDDNCEIRGFDITDIATLCSSVVSQDTMVASQTTEIRSPTNSTSRLGSTQPTSASTPNRTSVASRNKRLFEEDGAPDSSQLSSRKKHKTEVMSKGTCASSVQAASYALEILSNGLLRTHVIGGIVDHRRIRLVFYDRSGIVYSKPVHFAPSERPTTETISNPEDIEKLSKFVWLVYALQRLSPSQWGHMDDVKPPIPAATTVESSVSQKQPADAPTRSPEAPAEQAHESDQIDSANLESPPPSNAPATSPKKPTRNKHLPNLGRIKGYRLKVGDIDFEIADILHQNHAITGRGSCVAEGTPLVPESRLPLDGYSKDLLYVIKVSSLPKKRTEEWDFVKKARDHAQRTRKDMLNHLPNIIQHSTREFSEHEAQHLLHIYFGEADKEAKFELRERRYLIQEKLDPITEIDDGELLGELYNDIFKALDWLYSELGILHRDVSLNNCMVRIQNSESDKKYYGVLCDYDLAIYVYVDRNGWSSKFRTGTLPFMAIDLLISSRQPHRHRHDIESLFYGMVWHYTSYEGRELVASPPLEAEGHSWFTEHRREELGKNKLKWLIKPKTVPYVRMQPSFKRSAIITKAIAELVDFFADFYADLAPKRAKKVPSHKTYYTRFTLDDDDIDSTLSPDENAEDMVISEEEEGFDVKKVRGLFQHLQAPTPVANANIS